MAGLSQASASSLPLSTPGIRRADVKDFQHPTTLDTGIPQVQGLHGLGGPAMVIHPILILILHETIPNNADSGIYHPSTIVAFL
jgi:hypothetical protein